MLFLVIFLQFGLCFIERVTCNEAYEGKLERLQIEGTVRNLDESRLGRERSKFNSYWGSRNGWTEESIRRNWGRHEQPESIEPNRNAEMVYKQSKNAQEALHDSEIELIDPSKISEELAHLKFMRLEKRRKDI